MFSSGLIRLLDFLIYSVITVNTVFSVMKILFLFFVLRYFVSGVCLSIYLLPSVILNWVCWVRGNFTGGPGHILSVCVSPPCGVPGRYKFFWALSWSGWRDCTDFSFFWLCCSGYGTVEMVRGVVFLSSCFL